VPFPEPAQYAPARFEVVRRYLAQEKRPGILWDLYKLPGNKFDANNGIAKQFSMGLVGACNGWCEANEAGRAKIWEAHKQYILEMYRFLTTDPVVPERLRKELGEYGLCRDEFPETGHWSPQLYVREGRRMIGQYVLSQKDIIDDPEKTDAIAVSSFPIDSHDCQRIGTATFVLNEGTVRPVRMAGRKHGHPFFLESHQVISLHSTHVSSGHCRPTSTTARNWSINPSGALTICSFPGNTPLFTSLI
jgi:FAD dependent oxidoreductase